MARNQQHRHITCGNGSLNLWQPIVSSGNPAVIPDFQPLAGQYVQMADQMVFPNFVLVAIADEYLAHSMDSGVVS